MSNLKNETYQTIFGVSQEPILILDNENNVEIVNDAYLFVSGYRREDVLGRPIYNFIQINEKDLVSRGLNTTTTVHKTNFAVKNLKVDKLKATVVIRKTEDNNKIVVISNYARESIPWYDVSLSQIIIAVLAVISCGMLIENHFNQRTSYINQKEQIMLLKSLDAKIQKQIEE